MSIHRRVIALERRRGTCPECGGGARPAAFDVEWLDHEDDEPVEPEFCETCGRQITFVVTWNDIEPDGRPGEGGS